MKKKLYFITNPISGSSFARYLRNLDKIDQRMIDKYLDLSKFDYEIWITEYEGHASELAMKGLNSNADLIVAIGGDGTIREIASVLIGTNIPLGIIPAGSGNGLALHLAIPLNLKGAIEIINRFNVSEIDTGSICLVNEKEEKIKSTPQDETNTTYAKKISTEEAKINWNKSGKEILRQVKAFNPIPGAWFTVNKERIKIFDADISSSSTKSAGLILDKNFSISCGNGDVLNPKILQRSGKSQMDINTFIRGFHFEVNQKIE